MAKKKTPEPASGEFAGSLEDDPAEKGGLKNTIMMTMVTILIGGVFGDFIVKRNVQAYNKEADDFANMAKTLEAEFTEARNQYSQALRTRRGQTQRLVRNIASNSYIIFNQNYETYNNSVLRWNEIHQQMADTIISVTDCAEIYAFCLLYTSDAADD